MRSTASFLMVALLLSAARAAAAAEAPKHLALRAVPFTEVKVGDRFWAPRIETNRAKSLPHNFKWCEETGRISNFVKAARREGKFEGIYFNDSDVYKVLEGASYSLADRRDPALEKTVDEVIAKIASAQQPDGYLNTYYTLAEPGKRWTNLAAMHELYCAGHLIEAAVAHYRATGKKTLFDVAVKFADHIDAMFGPGKEPGICGHEEIELALVKLYQVTGNERYMTLARRMLDLRGDSTQRKTWGPYCQDHLPVRQQREIVGHAVRAMYLYSGVADVAAYTGDAGFLEAMDALWKDVVDRKLYLTGGIGARHEGEAFGDAYELPNESAYCETCAAIGLVFWAHRLNLLHGDARYADVLEQALYNGVLSGIALDGQHFFYVNPLASAGNHHRQPFFGCACCPSNVVRLVPSVPGYVYATNDEGVFVNLYVAGTATVPVKGTKVKLTQDTQYPWDGKVRIRVEAESPGPFDICLRIPGWSKDAQIGVEKSTIADDPAKGIQVRMDKGYARLRGLWVPGEVIVLDLPMPVERIEAHPKVKADHGRVAIRRGPIVYCFEAVDNGGPVRNLVLARDPKFATEHRDDLLGGVTVIKALARGDRPVTAVPYYAWDHRAPGEMVVWVRQDGKAKTPKTDDPAWEGRLYRPLDPATLGPSTPPTLAEQTKATASFCDRFGGTPTALCDEIEPKNSCDHDIPRFTWYDRLGTKEWVEYEFPSPQKVSAVSVYWFDDGRVQRHCRVPQSWRLLYRDGDQWKPVEGASAYGVEQDKFNRVTFKPVVTKALRIEAQLQPKWSAGILEWKVE
jgi:DUF1680 family protein